MTERERGSCRRDGDRLFARIRYGGGRRLELRITWTDSESEVTKRSVFIGKLAEQLVAARRPDLVKRIARQAADARTERDLRVIEKAVAQLCSRAKGPALGTNTTFGTLFDRWASGELHRLYPDYVAKKATAKSDVERYRKWIAEHMKDIPISMVTEADAERVMASLPETLSPATRRHVAQIIGRTMKLAAFPARLIPHSPIPRGFLPRLRRGKLHQFLYPAEEATFLGCEKIDIDFRLFVGILDREGMRLSELLDSEWWQWNLDVGVFTANRTKTGDPGIWSLQPDVAHAMRIWKAREKRRLNIQSEANEIQLPKPFASVARTAAIRTHLASRFRSDLRVAGIKRLELLDGAEHVAKLRVHDLRATFVTLSLAQGKTETWIRDRTAHRSTR